MGRILDLCGEIAAAAEEGAEGLVLPPDAWDRLRADWEDEDIEDAMGLVHDSLLQAELVESADSLSARLLEMLGAFGEEGAFQSAKDGAAPFTVEMIGALARRVGRLEEILEAYREGGSPDRRGFDALQRRLMDVGIEDEMESPEDGSQPSETGTHSHDGDDEEDDR